jgi:hypothetical protein
LNKSTYCAGGRENLIYLPFPIIWSNDPILSL